MTRRYTGGFLSATEQATDLNSANGIFSLAEAQEKTSLGSFPTGRWTPQRSLRFKSAASTYLTRTPATASSQTKGTWSFWVKRGSLPGSRHTLFSTKIGSVGNNALDIEFNTSNQINVIMANTGNTNYSSTTNNVYRDASAWYHIVVSVDTTQAISTNRLLVWVNGVAITSWLAYNVPSQNDTMRFGDSTYPHSIGVDPRDGTYFDGYMSEWNYIDNQALDPSYFGATDPTTGVWLPKRYSGAYGTNGFYLPFSNNAGSDQLGRDYGNGGNELVSNGFFDANVSGWTVTGGVGGSPSITWQSTGKARITNSANNGAVYYTSFPTVIGNTYYVTGNVSNISIGGSTRSCRIQKADDASNSVNNATIGTVLQSAGSGTITGTFVATATTSYIHLNVDILGTGNQGADWDLISVSDTSIKNHFNTNSFSLTAGPTYDSMVDVPGIGTVSTQNDAGGIVRGNYCTLNPVRYNTSGTLSNGNLNFANGSSDIGAKAIGTIGISSGKWYWEGQVTTIYNDTTRHVFGFASSSTALSTSNLLYEIGANVVGVTNTSGIIMLAIDFDAGKIWYGGNGTWLSNGNPATGANPYLTFTPSYYDFLYPGIRIYAANDGTSAACANFGQRPFSYTPPTGFKSLCTTNLPNPVIQNPANYFDVKGYYGTGDTQTIGAIQKQTPGWPVKNSLRFRQSNGAHFTRTTSATAATNSKIWTYSVWAKKQITNIPTELFSATSGSSTCQFLLNGQPFDTDGSVTFYDGGSGPTNVKVATIQRDTNQWHHYVLAVDTTQADSAKRVRIYIDGILQPLSTATYPAQNFQTGINNASTLHGVGCQISNGSDYGGYWEGFMAEANFVDGQALNASAFGAFDANNNWVPQKYAGAYGNNGFYLNFGDASQPTFASNIGIGKDSSGNGNYWTSYGFSLGGTTVQSLTTVGSSTWVAPSNVTSVNAMIIAGGGGGGSGTWTGGGGGAGGVVFRTFSVTPGQSYSYTVGGGGGAASTGGDSIFNGVTAKGGGAGGSSEGATAGSGGSGGGGAPSAGAGGSAYLGQGNQGGNGATTSQGGNGSDTAAAGGGGYTYRASNLGYQNSPGYGGPGFATHITGNFSWYAAGGCGGGAYPSWNNYGPVVCHIGGGGGSRYVNYGNTSGNTRGATGPVANTGAGGGGCTNGNGGSGGASGIIVLSYNTAPDSSQQDYDISMDSPTDYANNSATADTGGVVSGNYCAWDSGFNLRNNGGTTANWYASYDSQTPDWQPGTYVYDAGSSAIIGHYVTYGVRGTTPVKSGKWYWEVKVLPCSLDQYNATYAAIGIECYTQSASAGSGYNDTHVYRAADGNYQYPAGSINQSFGATYTSNDVIGVALDLNAGTLSFYKNNVLQGTIANNILGKIWVPFVGKYTTGAWTAVTANFGDRPFKYTPPSGFKSLNSANIIAQGAQAGYGGQFAGGPDLVWIKQRSGAQHHVLFDTVRGAGNILQSSSGANTQTDYNTLAAFRGSGFELGPDTTYTNIDSQSYVAWAWKRGKIPGFDIVQYAGDGVSNRDVPHNLGVVPAMIWNKALNGSGVWRVICKGMTSGYNLELDSNGQQFALSASTSGGLGDLVSSSTFRLQNGTTNNANVNTSGNAYINYLWAEVPGFSKFGVYQGNASTDGPFIYCGFRPKYILIKDTNYGEQWFIHDSVRDPYNPTFHNMWANSTGAEDTYAHNIDLVSNGFKLRQNAFQNYNNQYIYMAFAEAPFKYANAR